MTNNELSRKVLEALQQKSGAIRFKDLVDAMGVDARTVFKNLFFLEEKGYVQLSTSNPSDAVYPQIHLIRLRKGGEQLLSDPKLLDHAFPLHDVTTDTAPHIPPDLKKAGDLTFRYVLDLLAAKVGEEVDPEQREEALEQIESLLGMEIADAPVFGPGSKK